MDATDQHLLSDFISGKEQSFRKLLNRHVNLVYGVAIRNTSDPSAAEEVVQDVFILLAKKAHQLRTHPSLAGWLHLTSRNIARDALRKRLGHQQKLEHFAETAPTFPTVPDQDLEAIDLAVGALPTKEREAILLRFFEDQDYAEIADRLSISEPAARKRVSRGIKRLHTGLRTKLAAGTALAVIAPSHLAEAVTVAAPTAIASSTGTTLTQLIMTKTTASLTCAAIIIAGLGYLTIDQNSKRKQLEQELATLRETLTDQPGEQPRLSAINQPADYQTKRIKSLEEDLSAERSKREASEKEIAALREATADLEDEIVLSYGKVEEVGSDFGSIFKEARALSLIEEAGELEDPENKKRLINFSMKAASISGLSKQIIGFDGNPEEGSKFFSATYKEVFSLDDASTKSLEKVLATQLAAAKERGLTLPNNPAFKMLEGDEDIDESAVETWLTESQEFYRGIRESLREQIPSSKHAEFDELVEEDGIGFMNVQLMGRPLGFSLGGKQKPPED